MPDDDLRLTPVSASLRKQVEAQLRNAIVTGRFRPGTHLSDKRLCEMFGVSRPLVREAMRQLEAEDLIETLPHRGSFVRTMTIEEAEQIYSVRGVLEALAAAGFAAKASNRQMADLQAIFEQIRDARDNRAKVDLLPIKQRFYEVLTAGCGNKYVTNMLNQLLNRNTLLRAMSLSNPGRLDNTVTELQRLMDALAARDADAAWKASFDHVRNAGSVALAALRKEQGRSQDEGAAEAEGESARLPGNRKA